MIPATGIAQYSD